MPKQTVLAGALSLLALLTVQSAAAELSIEVAAGKHDRQNTPVSVLVRVPAELAKSTRATVTTADGARLPAQLTAPNLLAPASKPGDARVTRELHFMSPELKAGQTLRAKVEVLPAAVAAKGKTFHWKQSSEHQLDLLYGDRPVLRYMHAPFDDSSAEQREKTYKVFHHVFSPDGKQIVTKGAGGRYTHHRGLFYGFAKTTYGDGQRCDTWHCKPGKTHQAHDKVLSSEAGPVLGRHVVSIHWCGADGHPFAEEHREMTAYATPGGTLIQFRSRLLPLKGAVKVDGDPQHAGFQFRASDEVNSKTARHTYYVRPDGKDKPGSYRNWSGKTPEKHANLPFNAMSFMLGEQRFTAAYLDHPDNPKPARYSERNYGRFGSYFVSQATKEKPLEVTYRVWLQEGEMTPEEVARLDADFDHPPQAHVSK